MQSATAGNRSKFAHQLMEESLKIEETGRSALIGTLKTV